MNFSPLLLSALTFSLSAAEIPVADAFGEIRKVTTSPARTVICYPSLLEIWLDCGGFPAGMHTPRKADPLPPGLENVPRVGSYMHPNMEAVVRLKPDLVILSGMTGRHRAFGELLRKSGIEVLHLKYDNYSDYARLAGIFSSILATRSASTVCEKVQKEVDSIIRRCSGRKGPTFLVLFFNGAEFRAETSRAHAAYIFTALGGRNILDSTGSAVLRAERVSFSPEELLLKDPDRIFLIPGAKSDALNREALRKFLENPSMRNLKAVRTNRLHVLPSDLFQYKPNRRFPEAFRYAENLLYGKQP